MRGLAGCLGGKPDSGVNIAAGDAGIALEAGGGGGDAARLSRYLKLTIVIISVPGRFTHFFPPPTRTFRCSLPRQCCLVASSPALALILQEFGVSELDEAVLRDYLESHTVDEWNKSVSEASVE